LSRNEQIEAADAAADEKKSSLRTLQTTKKNRACVRGGDA
jgi:hypothetical protein